MSTSGYSSMWASLIFNKKSKNSCIPNVSNMVDMSDPSIKVFSFLVKRLDFESL